MRRAAGSSAVFVTLTNSTVSGNSAAGDVWWRICRGLHRSNCALVEVATASSPATALPADRAPDVAAPITSSNGHNIFGSDVDGQRAGRPGERARRACCSPAGSPTMAARPQTIALRDAADNPALGRRRPGRRARHRPARRGAAAAGGHQPRHRRVRAEPDAPCRAQRDRRHGARRLPAWHGRRRPDPRLGRRRPAVGLGRRRRAVRRLRARRAGRQGRASTR